MNFAQLCEQRYSVRKYDSKPIEPEKLEMILNAGRLAPTAKNLQPQRILVVQGEGLEKMKECTPCMYGQTAVLVVCYDKEVSWKSRSGREIGDVDGGIVMTSMMYQAQDLGIGSLVVGIYKEEPLRASFNIPENYEVVALLMLGYPAEDSEPNEKLHYSRKDLSETVSYGTF
ncbi:MAG: nitroreductase family protein [Oscillospiraceae bacterium]|nr:nitroreductase family protein [Oscillospiraceae bacterium]